VTATASAEVEERIVDAAVRCASRVGLRRFSMADVATAAGLSRGTVYNHFGDRSRLVDAVLVGLADQFVAASRVDVMRRRTLAGQVGEAAVFIHRHTNDRRFAIGDPDVDEHLLAVLLSMRAEPLLEAWVAFWEPLLAAAEQRGEVRPGLDRRTAGEWIVRSLVTFAVMPSIVIDLDDDQAVRTFVGSHIIRGLAP
jgi:AcrR family transcriptional regulator